MSPGTVVHLSELGAISGFALRVSLSKYRISLSHGKMSQSELAINEARLLVRRDSIPTVSRMSVQSRHWLIDGS